MNLEYPWDDERIKYKNIDIYKCKDRYLLIGNHSLIPKQYGILHITIQKGSDIGRFERLIYEEEKTFESPEEISSYLGRITNNPQKLKPVYGILGFIKFLQGYYVILIQETKAIAKLGKHKIFQIVDTTKLQLFETKSDDNENKYRKLINDCVFELYSSYTYDVTSSLNKNLFPFNKDPILRHSTLYQIGKYRNMFLWNHFVLQEFDKFVKNKRWVLGVIQGYCQQINIKTTSNHFSICLIARRSIHHAGARYLTRGINDKGYVANFIETEQIVIELDKSTCQRPACSSFIQIRGSAPVYWYQEPNLLIPKPPIKIHQSDPFLLATRKHICDLISSYGKYIFMVNLVKANEHNPREQILAEEFENSIKSLKEELQGQNEIEVGYLHFDMKAQLKADKEDFVNKCYSLAHWCLMRTGVFLYVKEPKCNQNVIIEIQNGVVRSNCIDCLDRTNTFQQLIGEMALGIQLAKINQTSLKFNLIEVNDQIFDEFREMYEYLGDFISKQYGSSSAHKQDIGQTSKRFELYTSFQRHYYNNTSDAKKQQQIDLFLGIHKIPENKEDEFIWDIAPQVTLFPDVRYLTEHIGEGDWWMRPYHEFLEKSNINELSRICLEKEKFKKNSQVAMRRMQKKLTFNFDIIERMTQKSTQSKTKNQNKCVFIIEAPFVKIRDKPFTGKQFRFENYTKKAYYQTVFIFPDFSKENIQEAEFNLQRSGSNQEQSPTKGKTPTVEAEEIQIFQEYLRPKTYQELMKQANNIKDYIFKEMNENEEEKLRQEIKDYMEGKPTLVQVSKEYPKSDSVYDEKKSFYEQIEVKSSIVQSDAHAQVIQSINVHQPKKFSVEQKSVKFLESLLKKNISQAQRLKINKI